MQNDFGSQKLSTNKLADQTARADQEAKRARELAVENDLLRQQLAAQANLGA